jgi:hypothetical protein
MLRPPASHHLYTRDIMRRSSPPLAALLTAAMLTMTGTRTAHADMGEPRDSDSSPPMVTLSLGLLTTMLGMVVAPFAGTTALIINGDDVFTGTKSSSSRIIVMGNYLEQHASAVMEAQVVGGGEVFDELRVLMGVQSEDAPRLARAMRLARPTLNAALMADCTAQTSCHEERALRWLKELAPAWAAAGDH